MLVTFGIYLHKPSYKHNYLTKNTQRIEKY